MERSDKIEVKRSEVYRYLGFGHNLPDETTVSLVEDSIRELERVVSPRFFSRSFPLKHLKDGRLDFTCFQVESLDLSKNLKDCERVILFAATLGAGPDLLARRYGRLEMSRAVVLQAASAAMIEAWCDRKNEELKEEALRQGEFLRPRFSPGYGDFSLEYQKILTKVLETGKTVGVTLTDSLLMVPSKSVTAVIGAGRKDDQDEKEDQNEKKDCGGCGKADCPYRKG